MLRFHSHSIAAFGATLVLAFATAIAATPASASPASAATDAEARTKVVSFSDLDLTRSKGVRTLKRRIADAVARVCESTSRMTIREQQIYRVCAAEATADAHDQVEHAVRIALKAQPAFAQAEP